MIASIIIKIIENKLKTIIFGCFTLFQINLNNFKCNTQMETLIKFLTNTDFL